MNKVLTNFHTHTQYCDGANTPREMVEAALQRGFYALGFSGHGYEPVSGFGMTPEGMERYKKEISALRQEYAGRIALYLGLEVDAMGPQPLDGLDYVIGSVHNVEGRNGRVYGIDEGVEQFRACIAEGFHGDAYAMARAYYAHVEKNARVSCPDIIGHFDLLTKYNADSIFFDNTNQAYLAAAAQALEMVVNLGCIIEVNTGAMARGYAVAPYPDVCLLARIHAMGGAVMINSDAHDACMIDYAFDRAVKLLYAAGFRTRMELTANGFVAVEL